MTKNEYAKAIELLTAAADAKQKYWAAMRRIDDVVNDGKTSDRAHNAVTSIVDRLARGDVTLDDETINDFFEAVRLPERRRTGR